MGAINLKHTDSGADVTLSSDGTNLLLGGTAIGGGGADLYAANESSPTAQPSATGANAIAIGDSAAASAQDAISIGDGATNAGAFAVAVGWNAAVTSNGTRGIAIGSNATTDGQKSFAAGDGATITNTGISAVALGTSYASGADSFAAVIDNNTSSYGALGANSIAIGKNAKADYGLAIGITGATGTGPYVSAAGGLAIGNDIAVSAAYGMGIGTELVVNQFDAVAIGHKLKTRAKGQFVYGGVNDSNLADGDVQGSNYVLFTATTDATPTTLKTTWATSSASTDNQIVAASDTCIMFSGTIVAMQNGAQDQGGWEIKGLLKNDGGTTTLVSSNIQTFADGNGWTVALSADNTNNALAITCTGEAAHNIRWVANISTSEVTYA